MRILNSALKHGLSRDEITEAFARPIYEFTERNSPLKVILVGLGSRIPYIEIIYTQDEHTGETVIFHAMKASKQLINRAQRQGRI